MRQIYFILSVCLAFCSSIEADEAIQVDTTTQRIDIYLPARIQLGKGLEEYPTSKAETGLQMAISISNKALLYPRVMMDSVLSLYKDINPQPNAFQLASEVGAHHVLFSNISRIENILRVDLLSIALDSLREGFDLNDAIATAHKGEGFAFVNYWQQDGQPMLDPAIVAATQRAFAKLKRDSILYADAEKPYQIFPHSNLAIGGILIKDTTGFVIKSELFGNKLITSYAASEAVFEQMSKSAPYVTWDLATRDTLMTYEGLYGVENYNLATDKELSTLWKAGVGNVVFGKLTRIAKGGRIELYIGSLGQGGVFAKEKEISHIFEGDTVEILIAEMKHAVEKLLEK